MHKLIPLKNSGRCAAVSEEDYELVRHLEWHLAEGGWVATGIKGELVEMGIYLRRLRGEPMLSPAPWRDKLN